MSRALHRCRPYVVWLGVTAAALTATAAVPGAWQAAAEADPGRGVAAVLVAGCALGLAGSLVWLWLVTTVTVVEIATGSVPRTGGAARRLVLAACGAAVVAGTALPAQAAGGEGVDVLVGLPLPERAVGPAAVDTSRAAAAPSGDGRTYVVGPGGPPGGRGRGRPPPAAGRPRPTTSSGGGGGSSWGSLAGAHPAPAGDVGLRWRAIWRDNRDVVGDDPDLIHPGQALRLPGTDPNDEKDGERR